MNGEYDRQLESLKESHPHLTRVLSRAQENRETHLAQMRTGVRLAGLDEWLGYLHVLQQAFQSNPELQKIAFIIGRIKADFEVASEATLSGMHAVVLDVMRDVMECYMLLREFRFDPNQIDDWLRADHRELITTFSPRELSTRHAARLNVEPKDLAESSDYKAHSRSLHVSPTVFPWEKRGIIHKADEGPLSDMCYWEIYSHAESIAVVITELVSVLLPGHKVGPDVESDLLKVAKAYERVSEMKQIFLDLITPSLEEIPEAE